jgi:hypothetical protein
MEGASVPESRWAEVGAKVEAGIRCWQIVCVNSRDAGSGGQTAAQ